VAPEVGTADVPQTDEHGVAVAAEGVPVDETIGRAASTSLSVSMTMTPIRATNRAAPTAVGRITRPSTLGHFWTNDTMQNAGCQDWAWRFSVVPPCVVPAGHESRAADSKRHTSCWGHHRNRGREAGSPVRAGAPIGTGTAPGRGTACPMGAGTLWLRADGRAHRPHGVHGSAQRTGSARASPLCVGPPGVTVVPVGRAGVTPRPLLAGGSGDARASIQTEDTRRNQQRAVVVSDRARRGQGGAC